VTELDRAWAETQIEAMADGSLSAEGEQRMRAAMRLDPELAARVERARALRRELQRLAEAPVPPGLWRRLWRIPSPGPSRIGGFLAPAGVLATAVVAALSVGVFLSQPDETPIGAVPMDEAQAAAVQDVAIAVTYLHKSMVMANNEINEVVGSGVLGALVASRGMMDRTESNGPEGERQNGD
jgi:anti-sigma factor RsiW